MGIKFVSLLICAMIATAVHAGNEALVLEQQQRTMRTLVSNLQMLDLVAVDAINFDQYRGFMGACFKYTQSQQKKNLASFQTQMGICEKAEINSKKKLSRQSSATRTELVKRGTSHCERMRKCESLSDDLDFFICYGKATSTSSKDLQNISLTSNEQVENMKMDYQQIAIDKKKCIINAEKSYAKASAETDQEMQSCFNGKFVPPESTSTVVPPAASTPGVPTVSTSTAVPAVSTSTAVPTVSTSTAVPTVSTSTAVPSVSASTDTPSTAVPTIATSTAVPTVSTSTAVPTVSTSNAVPTVTSTALPTVSTPTDASSTALPTVSTSTDDSTTSEPTLSTSTDASSTDIPTASTTTNVSSTAVPTVSTSTAVPSADSSPAALSSESAVIGITTRKSDSEMIKRNIVEFMLNKAIK